MAQYLNPLTGLMEDDGVPIAPPSAPVVAQVAPAPAPAPVVEDLPAISLPNMEPQQRLSEVSTQSTSTRQTVPTAGETNLLKQRESDDLKELELQKKASEAGKVKAIEDSAQADERAKLAADKETRTQSIITKGEEGYNKAIAERDAQYETLKGMKLTDYWESQSTGNKILAGIGVMLGGIGGGMSGEKGNRALDVINKAIDTDLEIQKGNIAKQLSVVQQADKGIDNAKDHQDYLVNNVNLVKEAAYGNIVEKYAAAAKKRGVSEQDLINDINYQNLIKKQNEAKLDYEKGLRKSVDSSTQKQINQSLEPVKADDPSEGQGKARGFASRMVNNLKNYDKSGGISPKGADAIRKHFIENAHLSKDATGLMKYVIKPGSKPLPSGLSERDRLAWSAIEDFARANLRKESGAAITESEHASEINQVMPTVGDTPQVLAAKRKLMTQKLAALQYEVGRAKINIPNEPTGNGESKPSESSGDVRMVTPEGREIVVPANKVKEAEANGAKRK